METRQVTITITGKAELFPATVRAMTVAGVETELQYFTRRYGIDRQREYMRDNAAALRENCPTVEAVTAHLGETAVRVWLQGHIHNLAVYCGTEIHSTHEREAGIAEMMMTRYGRLRISEVLLFFGLVKSGDIELGTSYIDGRVMLRALKAYADKIRPTLMDAADKKATGADKPDVRTGLLGLRDYNRQARAEGREVTPALRVKDDLLDWTDEAFLAYAEHNRVTEQGMY